MKKLLILILLLFLVSCNPTQTPEINLPVGQDIVNIYDEHEDEGCFLKSGLVNLEMLVISSNVDTNIIGQYEIVYQITFQEVTYTSKRVVLVVDRIAPIWKMRCRTEG